MAELPEIILISRQMDRRLAKRTLTGLEIGQPKSLNVPAGEFEPALLGRRLKKVGWHGKWLILHFAPPGPNLLIHPGMGMDILDHSVSPAKQPQFNFRFSGGRGFSLRFWWFGYLRLAQPGQERAVMGQAGVSPLTRDFTAAALEDILAGRPNMGLKAFLMNQKIIAGIGNVYAQDICFAVRAHPLTKIGRLSQEQRAGLHQAIEATLTAALERGINAFEMDFHGRTGQWDHLSFQVGYRTGLPCPVCGTLVEKIKTGSTAAYICPSCQPRLE